MIRITKHKGIFIGLFISLVLLLIGFYFLYTSELFNKPVPKETKTEIPVKKAPTLVKVDFPYEITSITKDEIVLTAEKGKFILPYKIMTVEVYNGGDKTSPKIAVSDLKVGDNVNMEFIAGKSATLFVWQF